MQIYPQNADFLFYRWHKLLEKCGMGNRILYQIRHTFASRIPFVLKGSLYQDKKSKPVVVILTGDIESITPTAWKSGEVVEQEIKLQVHFYSLTIDSIPVTVIDTRNMICLIGGVDYLADLRSHLE